MEEVYLSTHPPYFSIEVSAEGAVGLAGVIHIGVISGDVSTTVDSTKGAIIGLVSSSLVVVDKDSTATAPLETMLASTVTLHKATADEGENKEFLTMTTSTALDTIAIEEEKAAALKSAM